MAASIDQQFIEYIVKSVVGKPDAVKIERRIDEKGVLLELSVDPEDLGRVIGKRGATAQSLRTLLRALGTKNDARYNLKIVDTDGGRSSAPSSSSSTSSDDASDEPASTAAEDQEVSEEIESQREDERTESENVDAHERMSEPESEVEEVDSDIVAEEPAETDHSSVIDKTRKELADLDDLDI